MAGKKIKLKDGAIGEILVADTNLFNQNMSSDSRVTINTVQRNNPPNCTVICVLLAAIEKAQLIKVPDVMWACAYCLV